MFPEHDCRRYSFPMTWPLVRLHYGQPIRLVAHYSLLNIPVLSALYPFNASPTAHGLVDLEPAQSIPEIWNTYAPAPGAEHLRLSGTNDPRLFRADNILRPLEYTLIDLK